MRTHEPIVYIVDDDASVRRSLTLLLKVNGYKAESFPTAGAFLALNHSDSLSCVLLDVRLPDLNGPVLQEIMRDRALDIPIVFISGHGSISMGVKAIKNGAVDFLPKPFSDEDLLNAVERAMARSKVQNKESAEVTRIKQRINTLSPRELEVFHLVSKGMLNKQIANKRGTALQTIKVHRGRVMHKLRAKTVTELIHFAQKAGIVFA